MHSVYIHIPFCTNICTYCAFTKFYYNEKRVIEYLNSLEQEIKLNYKGEIVKTLYIGGGSPSSLNISNLKKLFQIIEIFNLSNNLEFTIEVNPNDVTKEMLELFIQNKVNRISVGIESSNTKLLKFLGREYDFNLVKEQINLIKQYGIKNINVDLMYAIPTESLKDLENDIDNILSLDVSHISTYSLMIEPNTILKIKNVDEIDQELDYEMYKLIIKKLTSQGFKHYEVSNFAKNGYESRHNLVYWNNEHYYGFGLGSSGYIDNIRYKNTTSLSEYNKLNFIEYKEILTKQDIISYELILGFRKILGINKLDFYNKYHINIKDLYNIKELLKNKSLEENEDNIYISYDKIYIENSILVNFVGE